MRKVVVAGDLPMIIENREGVYQDNLRFYFWILFRQMGNNRCSTISATRALP